VVPRRGFSPEHLPYAGDASMVGYFKVVEIPTENDVI
jgi:hypothetical protein